MDYSHGYLKASKILSEDFGMSNLHTNILTKVIFKHVFEQLPLEDPIDQAKTMHGLRQIIPENFGIEITSELQMVLDNIANQIVDELMQQEQLENIFKKYEKGPIGHA